MLRLSAFHRRDFRLAVLLMMIAAIMLGSTWLGARRVETFMIQKQAETEVFNWARFAEFHLADINQILMYGRVTDTDESLIAAMAEANNVLRYRFFNRAGFIVLSSEAGEVGRRDVNGYLSDVVLGGGTFIKLQEEGRFAGLEPDLHGGTAATAGFEPSGGIEIGRGTVLAEAYTAVMENGRFNGAIEVHVNVSQTAEMVREVIGLAWLVMIGIVSALAVTTSFVIYQNVRDGKREQGEVRNAQHAAARAEAEVRRLNGELERRIADQSDGLKTALDPRSRGGGLATQS